jgi:hypothetical protein
MNPKSSRKSKLIKLTLTAFLTFQVIGFEIVALASADKVITLSVNGVVQQGKAPIFKNGSVLLPLNDYASAIGASVQWDAALKKITISQGGRVVGLTIDSKSAHVNGKKAALAQAP